MRNDTDKIEIENLNTPGRLERVDRAKYVAMKEVLLSVLPKTSPGLTVAEAKAELLPPLPQSLFPEVLPKVTQGVSGFKDVNLLKREAGEETEFTRLCWANGKASVPLGSLFSIA